MKLVDKKLIELISSPLAVDINEHLITLCRYSSKCNSVTEFGVRWIVSTWALLSGRPTNMTSYDIAHPSKFGADIESVYAAANEVCSNYRFIEADTSAVSIEKTDLLFIDTFHSYSLLKKELSLHHNKVSKYIIFHDIVSFGTVGEDGGPGIMKAINEFLDDNKQWKIFESFENNNGLLVLKKS